MNKQESDIITTLIREPFINQRMLSEATGHSLGIINKSLKNLCINGYLDSDMHLTKKTYQEIEESKPKNAVILAAGYGMRMVPINTEVPKGLLEIHGEPLIERLIKQLHEKKIYEIYVVVGFMKEHYEYLIDEYGVELIVNTEYAEKNNLHSLKCVLDYMDNTYVIPCDIWCAHNPFNEYEMYSWYMVSDMIDADSTVRVNRKMELVSITENASGNSMVGISYLTGKEMSYVKEKIKKLCLNSKYDQSFWEEALYKENKLIAAAKVVHSAEIIEINTYEQLRELDSNSNQLKSEAIDVIVSALNVDESEIVDISVLKKGMTNRSFLFQCKNRKYIMRIPGEGTDQLINRREEADVYNAIKDKKICDDIVYINPENGYKITAYLKGSRTCNPDDVDDLRKCMEKLKEFHELKLTVNHEFDIFRQIEFYESLWNGKDSVYRDYKTVKANVLSLKSYINKYAAEKVLTHIDAVPDNFLFMEDGDIRLIDWEYAGMQDPHVDIAMFCIYALYNRKQVDRLIDLYFEGQCEKEIRLKIYCYISACGLLWSNWCEYKRNLGIEFGEYSLKQYRYAKEYYKIVREELD